MRRLSLPSLVRLRSMDAPLGDGRAANAATETADLSSALYGEQGVLATDGVRVECHLCARWFVLLASHVRQAHGLTPAEYRALAGLNAQTALAGPRLRARRRALAEETLRPYRQRVGELGRSHTPEERAARMLGRRRRAEARLAAQDPERKAREADGHRQTVATRRARYGDAYQSVPGGFADRQAAARASRRGLAARRERLRDPAYREAVGRRISEARGGRVTVACAVCGTSFAVPPSWLRNGSGTLCGAPACRSDWRRRPRTTMTVPCAICEAPVLRTREQLRDRVRTTCGPACLQELKRRLLATRPPLDAATRAKAVAASRQRLSDPALRDAWRARVQAAALRRGRPHAEALRALPAAAFDVLPDPERELIRRYYGLDGHTPETQRALATRFQLTGSRVGQVITRGVARLLWQDTGATEQEASRGQPGALPSVGAGHDR